MDIVQLEFQIDANWNGLANRDRGFWVAEFFFFFLIHPFKVFFFPYFSPIFIITSFFNIYIYIFFNL